MNFKLVFNVNVATIAFIVFNEYVIGVEGLSVT
jgi:hypothetical protein